MCRVAGIDGENALFVNLALVMMGGLFVGSVDGIAASREKSLGIVEAFRHSINARPDGLITSMLFAVTFYVGELSDFCGRD